MTDLRRPTTFDRYMKASLAFESALKAEIGSYVQGERDPKSFPLSLRQRARMQKLGDQLVLLDPDYVQRHAKLIEERIARAHNASLRK